MGKWLKGGWWGKLWSRRKRAQKGICCGQCVSARKWDAWLLLSQRLHGAADVSVKGSPPSLASRGRLVKREGDQAGQVGTRWETGNAGTWGGIADAGGVIREREGRRGSEAARQTTSSVMEGGSRQKTGLGSRLPRCWNAAPG